MARRRFEAAWLRAPPAPELVAFLPPRDDPAYGPTLAELAAIDLELAWRAGDPRSAASYLERFDALRTDRYLGDLVVEEQRARARHGWPALEPEAIAAIAERHGLVAPTFEVAPGEVERALAPGERLGPYHLDGVRARGGMGVVWQAADPALGRVVALKTLARPRDPEARARFLAEARVTARLEHPGIVPVHEVHDGPLPYYTMKLVGGRTLGAVIRDAFGGGGPEPLVARRLLETFLAVTRAVAFAHARGVIHRDLKPDNVLVGELGEVVVLDWGLARGRATSEEPAAPAPRSAGAPEVAEHLTRDGTVLGTPAYMAPEQAEGRVDAHDARTDVFALGVVLHEILTGARPARADAGVTLAARGLPRPLVSIMRRALAIDPAARYPDADALAQDVERLLADEPVLAHRERLHERLGRSVRRHRTAWVASLVALVVTLVGSAVVLFVRQGEALERRALAAAAAARDEALARGHLVGGRADAAVATLDLALARLVTDDTTASSPTARALIALRDRARRLHTFTTNTEEAWFLAGEERDAEVLEAIERALAPVTGARTCADLEADLPIAAVELCRRRAHRLMLLDAVTRAKGALAAPLSDRAKSACDAAWRSLARARAEGPTGFADLVQALCATQSSDVPPVTARTPPAGATDAYFFGLANLWLRDLPPALAIVLGPIMNDPERGLDLADPIAAAVDRLREAVRLEPTEYWHQFMLGNALSLAGDHRAAALVFGTCVAQRPEYPRGLEARGLAAMQEGLAAHRPDLVAQGLADFERALALAPRDPWTWWSRVHALRLLGRGAEAVAAALRALALDPDGLWRALPTPTADATTRLSTHAELERADALARDTLAAEPGDRDALTLRAAARLCLGDEAEAARALAALEPLDPRGLARTLRGVLALRRRDAARALPDLEDPAPLALAAKALALDALARPDDARAARAALAAAAETDGQRAWAAGR
ncbi:MAG: serine/threonine protein kinase [Deltaproteobacteria bacterium]|nr:serine/threonine protein kinase [Deltaproteobacteria bacterium]